MRTASNDPSASYRDNGRFAVVRTYVDGLTYGQTYHYRLFVRYPNGDLRHGSDRWVRMEPAALRPPQQVGLRLARDPTPTSTVLDRITILDALPGSTVGVSCTGTSGTCQAPERRVVSKSGMTIFEDWRVKPPGYLSVIIGGKGVGTLTRIRPRPDGPPLTDTLCGGFGGPFDTKCVSVGVNVRGRKIQRFAITHAVRGSQIDITCRGPGCPRDDLRVRVNQAYMALTLKRFDGLRPGAVLRVFITRPETYGMTRAFKVRKHEVTAGPSAASLAKAHGASSPVRGAVP